MFSSPTGESFSTSRDPDRNRSDEAANRATSNRVRRKAESDLDSPTLDFVGCDAGNVSRERKPSARRREAGPDDLSLPSGLRRYLTLELC